MTAPAGRLSPAGLLLAWGGGLLFALSLAYFLFTYVVTFGEPRTVAAPLRAFASDLGLFTAFALHHSVFARERVRALVARTVPPALERSAYVWLASLLFIAVCAAWQPLPGIAWRIPAVAGYAVMAVGVLLTLASAAAIDVWELAGIRPAPPADASGTEFKSTGPYGLVRHPIYLGWILMVFGIPVMTGTRLAFAAISTGYLVLAIPLEERTLRRTTGGKYADYVGRVRWRLIPGLY